MRENRGSSKGKGEVAQQKDAAAEAKEPQQEERGLAEAEAGSKELSAEEKEEEAQQVARMGTAPVGRLLLEFCVPAVAGNVLTALYNVIDSVFLGNAMGEVGLAATTVAMPIMTTMMALAVLAGAGGNSYTAILLGRGEHDRAEQALGNTMFLMIVFAIPVAFVATFCLDPILRVVGATDVTLPYSHRFVQIVLYGFIFNNISFGISNFMRTAGTPWRALGVSGLGAVVCIALNALFVLKLGWGVRGSALATITGQAIASVWVLRYFIFNKNAPFHLKARYLKPDGKLCLHILSLGLAPCALQAAAAITQVAGNSVMAGLGAQDEIGTDGALASIGVTMKIVMFTIFPASGIAIGAQPVLGFNVGARKFDRVKRALFDAIGAAFVLLLCFFIAIHLWPRQIIGLFGVEEHLMDFAVTALQIQTAMLPFACIQVIGSNYFQATGQPAKSTMLSLSRQLIFLLPMYFILPAVMPNLFPQVTGLIAFCFAFPVADFLAAVLCSIFLIIEIRRLNGLIRQQREGQNA